MSARNGSYAKILIPIIAVVSTPVVAQSCFQSLSVIDERVLESGSLDIIVQDLSGRSCGSIETERTSIYLDHLSGISEDTFRSFDKWLVARRNTAAELRTLRKKLREARLEGESDEKWNAIKVLSINAIGAGITIAGCLGASFTGVSAYLCVGGLGLTGVSTFDGLSGADFQARSKEIEFFVDRLAHVLSEQEALGEEILNEAQQVYLRRFEMLCRVVKTECQ